MKFLNIAAYKFIALNELPTLRTVLKSRCQALELLGTILVSPEGINMMLVGAPENISAFQAYLAKDARFADLHYKKSYSHQLTFEHLFVKIKKEIIAFDIASVDPVQQKAPYIQPQELKQWLDENRDIVLLDARNDYEIQLGTFNNSVDLNIKHFRDFPEAAKKLDASLKEKTIVTFCTGGIRCEKAALLLQEYGFKKIYQLEGGILDYFETCGNAHYNGQCYIFDQRVGLNAALEAVNTT
jgi:predicted sulfurtransferase